MGMTCNGGGAIADLAAGWWLLPVAIGSVCLAQRVHWLRIVGLGLVLWMPTLLLWTLILILGPAGDSWGLSIGSIHPPLAWRPPDCVFAAWILMIPLA